MVLLEREKELEKERKILERELYWRKKRKKVFLIQRGRDEVKKLSMFW